jgi:hypothetical protein
VQKDPTTAAPVQVALTVGGRDRRASVLRLTGDALDGTATQVQGATVDGRGLLRPGAPDTVRVSHGVLDISIAAGSAAIITL